MTLFHDHAITDPLSPSEVISQETQLAERALEQLAQKVHATTTALNHAADPAARLDAQTRRQEAVRAHQNGQAYLRECRAAQHTWDEDEQ